MTPAERKADRILATKPWVRPRAPVWVDKDTRLLSGRLTHYSWYDNNKTILLCGRVEPPWKRQSGHPGLKQCAVCDAVWKMILAIAALERSVS